MRHTKTLFLLFLLAFLTALPATAQESNLVIECSLIRSTQPPERNLLDAAAFSKEIAAGRHQVLNRGSVIAHWNQDVHLLMGKKIPLSYYEPRAEAPQVQYVDDGFSLDCKVKQAPGDLVRLEVRVEQTTLTGADENLEEADGFTCQSTILLKRGQTAVLASNQGVLTAFYLGQAYPGVALGEDTTVFFTVTVR